MLQGNSTPWWINPEPRQGDQGRTAALCSQMLPHACCGAASKRRGRECNIYRLASNGTELVCPLAHTHTSMPVQLASLPRAFLPTHTCTHALSAVLRAPSLFPGGAIATADLTVLGAIPNDEPRATDGQVRLPHHPVSPSPHRTRVRRQSRQSDS